MSLPRKRAGGPRTTGTRGDWDITAKAPEKPPKDKPKPKARSTLKPGKGLERGKPLERGDSELKRTRIAPVSDKTKARRPERDAIRKQTCALAHLGGCAGIIDTHEIVRRSQMAEAAYMDDLTIGACRLTHHALDKYKLLAEWVGLRIPVEFYKRNPVGTVEEAARRRADQSGVPSWWSHSDIEEFRAGAHHYPPVGGRPLP